MDGRLFGARFCLHTLNTVCPRRTLLVPAVHCLCQLYTARVYKESASPAGFGVHISRNQVFIGLFGGNVYRKNAPQPHIAVHTSSVQRSLFSLSEIILIFAVRSAPLRTGHRPGGEMVDTRDLKSLGPKRPCGFDSRPGHAKKHRGKRCFFGYLWRKTRASISMARPP